MVKSEEPQSADDRVNILLVDDRPDKLMALEIVLAGLGQNLILAHSGTEALRHLLQHEFALIVLDVSMPGMDGFETASLIRQRSNSALTPIIFISAHDDPCNQGTLRRGASCSFQPEHVFTKSFCNSYRVSSYVYAVLV